MSVRDADVNDLPAVRQIHLRMGMDYRFPEIDGETGDISPLFLVRKVKTDASGKVVAACFLKVSAETYLWLEPEISAQAKMQAMLEMQPEVLSEAYRKGLDDIEARIPETVERRFLKRLQKLGWVRNRPGWFPWSRATQ